VLFIITGFLINKFLKALKCFLASFISISSFQIESWRLAQRLDHAEILIKIFQALSSVGPQREFIRLLAAVTHTIGHFFSLSLGPIL
jgi:hypothetical protein